MGAGIAADEDGRDARSWEIRAARRRGKDGSIGWCDGVPDWGGTPSWRNCCGIDLSGTYACGRVEIG